MANSTQNTIYRKDYQPPSHKVLACYLDVNILADKARITNKMTLQAEQGASSIILMGEGLVLQSVMVDGTLLADDAYHCDDSQLRIDNLPETCTLSITADCDTYQNTALEGLYMSGDMLCTQCEPEGFRRICYYLDRPDVLAPFQVRIEADKSYPQLLSNGNLVETGDLPDNRHYALWDDPHPKPSYLFALVAGDLALVADQFTTASGRQVDLHIYVEHGNDHLTAHAMDSLKRSMKWDEDVYGLEYDLDLFQIVAVSHFNMGAMENKGLNIFNSKYVLADFNTATDDDLDAVEAIIAHEYFHNWTGNRVTCRDWFQLTLKEGLTVYRDQCFSADMHDSGVKRAADVATLRAVQFPEDASPNAHPIRPESFVEINNFYTPTIYEKGAEIIRMMASQLGKEGYRKGTDLYFERHDGAAVTCDDFIAAMADANQRDFSLMQRWYSQAGTPSLTIKRNGQGSDYQLDFSQSLAETNAQTACLPVPILVKIGFLAQDGSSVDFAIDNGEMAQEGAYLLTEGSASATITFAADQNGPVTPSLLRDFSAPVTVIDDLSEAERLHLMAHDTDAFNRWDQTQKLLEAAISKMMAGKDCTALIANLASAYQLLLADEGLRGDFKALMMAMPSQAVIEAASDNCDPVAVFAARSDLRSALGVALLPELKAALTADKVKERRHKAEGRHFQNALLAWAVASGDESARDQALLQSHDDVMSLSQGALNALNAVDCQQRDDALAAFHDRWHNDSLVMEKWFRLCASAPVNGTIEHVTSLMRHPQFDPQNPNKLRAVLGAFVAANPVQFHRADGAGYEFIASQLVEIDKRNPQIAARMAIALTRMKSYDGTRQAQMRKALAFLQDGASSRDVTEIVTKALNA